MFYVYGFYLPVTLVVLLSWISFWIDADSTPARVSLGVITILAMGNFLHGGGATPNVSYATALDVYIITCFVFVFASLLEYAAVHCALNRYQKASMNEVNTCLYLGTIRQCGTMCCMKKKRVLTKYRLNLSQIKLNC